MAADAENWDEYADPEAMRARAERRSKRKGSVLEALGELLAFVVGFLILGLLLAGCYYLTKDNPGPCEPDPTVCMEQDRQFGPAG